MSYEAVGDYLSKTNRRAGQEVSEAVEAGSAFVLKQIAKEEKRRPEEEISVERVEQIPKKVEGHFIIIFLDSLVVQF